MASDIDPGDYEQTRRNDTSTMNYKSSTSSEPPSPCLCLSILWHCFPEAYSPGLPRVMLTAAQITMAAASPPTPAQTLPFAWTALLGVAEQCPAPNPRMCACYRP